MGHVNMSSSSNKMIGSVGFVLVAVLCTVCINQSCGAQPTKEQYHQFQLLQNALLNDDSSESGLAPNLYILAETFYPKQQSEPICVPVTYHVVFGDCVNCNGTEYNSSFLWTQYDVGVPIGSFLLSYSQSGIVLRGFDWEDACIYMEDIVLHLEVGNYSLSDESLLQDNLRDLSTLLKGYAAAQGVPKVDDANSKYKAYAIPWNDKERNKKTDDNRLVLLAALVVQCIFILFLSLAMATYSYDTLYDNVKGKKNPAYPLFWGLVVVSICWNVAPSWIVLTRYSRQVYVSLIVIVILQFFVAFIIPKKSCFPIPCLRWGCQRHESKSFTFERVTITCFRCVFNHTVQVLSIWSILVSFAFVIYYLSAIIVAFYLYPTQTLVKFVFLKAVAVCLILNVALIFSISHFKFQFSWGAIKEDATSVVTLIAVITFLPVLGFLAFIIGGILFSESSQNSGLSGILTLIPSGFLLIVAWVSRGTLFPEGIHNADPGKEIVDDLEKGATHHDEQPPSSGGSSPGEPYPSRRLNSHPSASVTVQNHGELQRLNKSGEHVDGGTVGPSSGETMPLLQS